MRDVTDSCPIIVLRRCLFDPLKPREFKASLGLEGKECFESFRWHWYFPVTPPTAGRAPRTRGECRNRNAKPQSPLCLWLPHPLTLLLLLKRLPSISPPGVFHILFNELQFGDISSPATLHLEAKFLSTPKYWCWTALLLGWYFH